MTTPLRIKPRDWSTQPKYIASGYRSTALRGPTKPLIPIRQSLPGLTGPVYEHESVGKLDADLTGNARCSGEPLGERIVVSGRGLGDDGRPVPGTLIEIWQANACGRYVHRAVQHDAPSASRPQAASPIGLTTACRASAKPYF